MWLKVCALVGVAASVSTHTAWSQECGQAGPRKECTLTLDRAAPESGKSVKVENGTTVTVVLINKSPFESCKNEVKREEIPDVSAIPTLLSLVSDVARSFVVGATSFRGLEAKSAAAKHIADTLQQAAAQAATQGQAAEELQKRYDGAAAGLKQFYRTRYTAKDEAAFENARSAQETVVAGLVQTPLPQSAGAEALYGAARSAYTKYLQSPEDPTLVPALAAQLDLTRRMLDALADAIKLLDAARVRFQSTLDYLKQLKTPGWEMKRPLPADRNAKVTGSVSCTSDVTGQATLDPPVVYTVVFGSIPRITLTAGVLLSTVPRNSVGVEPVVDSRTDAVPATHSEIRDHPSRPQAVPFSFINIRLFEPMTWRHRTLTINAAPGVGVNPNNGGTNAEFFLGGSVGFDSLFVSAGVHIGHALRPANGFQIGDRPPSNLTVPVETPWTPGLGLAVSYRIPLK